MKAISYKKACSPKIVDINEPYNIKEDWVKIKVKRVGLCGSDIQKFFSQLDPKSYLKTDILGHEISGQVAKVGKRIKNINIGDRVTINPLIPCNNCEKCKQKKYQLCVNLISLGKQLPGGFSQFVIVPAKNLLRVPIGVSYEDACLNDVVAVVLHAYHLSGSPVNKKILIIGDGSVALILLQLLVHNKNKVTLIGKHDNNLLLAKSFGATINKKNQLIKQNKFDHIFEAVGKCQNNTIKTAIENVKPGGKIIVLGVFDVGFIGRIEFRKLFYKEVALIGSNSYGFWKGKNEFNEGLKLLEKKIVKPILIISQVVGMSEINSVLKAIKNKKNSHIIKVLFDPDK
jgi:L-iditol 2-dehydrogenase